MVGEATGTREIRFRNMPRSLIPVMTPHGSLRLDQADDDFLLESGLADRLEKSFERGSGHGLLHLGAGEAGSLLPPSLAWWRDRSDLNDFGNSYGYSSLL